MAGVPLAPTRPIPPVSDDFIERLKGTTTYSILQSLFDAATLPGDVYAGEVDPLSDEAIGRAFDLAGSLTLGAGAIPARANELRMGIKAYHGSPHDFDRFSMDKIGTGEGAQAYGHGLYFAEAENVAKQYRDTLSNRSHVPENVATDVLKSAGGDREQALQILGYMKTGPGAENFGEGTLDAAEQLLRSNSEIVPRDPGRMYEVEIAADPEQFLDWDAPLSEQSEAVKRALQNAGVPTAPRRIENALKSVGIRHAASEAERELHKLGPASEASKKLRQAGIPGIKYLDQGSRAAGDGTRNYVVFDDSLITILKKYGLLGPAALAAAMADLFPDEAAAEEQ